MKPIREYSVIVFDCDGVLLDSNKIKTNAFYDSTLIYGEPYASQFRDYHVANGGISRYKKFEYFFFHILGREPVSDEYEVLLVDYADRVKQGLITCACAEGLEDLRAKTPNADWMVASGGDQAELRVVFEKRGLSKFFNLGVYGSPSTKEQIIAQQLGSRVCKEPILFVGDSTYDHRAASQFEMDFVFASAWTELPNWSEYTKINSIHSIHKVKELIES